MDGIKALMLEPAFPYKGITRPAGARDLVCWRCEESVAAESADMLAFTSEHCDCVMLEETYEG